MNINPFSPTIPHYDSYDDFYKFFEVYPREVNGDMPAQVFPPIKPLEVFKEAEKETIVKESINQERNQSESLSDLYV